MADISRENGSQWNIQNDNSRRVDPPEQWDFAGDLEVEEHNERKESENKEQSPVRQSLDEVKKHEKFRKIQRIKTEKMVNQIAQNNPEKLGEASRDIINRIDNFKLQKNNLPEQISPKYKNKSPDMLNSIEKQSPQVPISDIESGNASNNITDNVIKQPPKKAPTQRIDMPAAAVIARNVVSYDFGSKGKTSRNSIRKSEPSDSDYGKSTNVVIAKSISVKPGTKVTQPDNKMSSIYYDANDTNNGHPVRKDSPSNLNGLLEDLQNDNNDVFGNPVDEYKATLIDTQEDEINEEQLLKELDESSEINDFKPENRLQQIAIMKELKEMQDMHSGFMKENHVMRMDDEDYEPINLSDSIGKFGDQLIIPQPKKDEKMEEPPSPNQFNLDDLMDEFGESHGGTLKAKMERKNKEESENGRDFLDEF